MKNRAVAKERSTGNWAPWIGLVVVLILASALLLAVGAALSHSVSFDDGNCSCTPRRSGREPHELGCRSSSTDQTGVIYYTSSSSR
jgi:hypothetical protein